MDRNTGSQREYPELESYQREILDDIDAIGTETEERSLESMTPEEWTKSIIAVNRNRQNNELELSKFKSKIIYKISLTTILTSSVLILVLWGGLAPITGVAFLGGLAAGVSLMLSE